MCKDPAKQVNNAFSAPLDESTTAAQRLPATKVTKGLAFLQEVCAAWRFETKLSPSMPVDLLQNTQV